jgi:hypothetical protein
MSILFTVSIVVVVVLVFYYFEYKLQKIDRKTEVIALRLESLLVGMKVHYPHPETLPSRVIDLDVKGRRSEACTEIVKVFGCTYCQAEQSIKHYNSFKEGNNESH